MLERMAGLRALTQASLIRNLVPKLSVQSITRSQAPISSAALAAVRRSAVDLHIHVRIERAQALGRQLRLGPADGIETVQRLPMQVRGFQPVAIDNADPADAGAGQVAEHRYAQAAGPDHQDARGTQLRLALRADFLQRLLARVVGGRRARVAWRAWSWTWS